MVFHGHYEFSNKAAVSLQLEAQAASERQVLFDTIS
jgi:hypothetical protein